MAADYGSSRVAISEKGAVRLLDALTALISVAHYIRGETFGTYQENAMLCAAVERKLEIIGEALTVFRRLEPDTAALIADLPRAVRLRNFLAHDYGAIDNEIVWDVATVHCPAMQKVVGNILGGGS